MIDLIKKLDYQVVEKPVTVDEFLEAEEVFLVSTVSRVMPVRAIDQVCFSVCGDYTRQIMQSYEDLFFSSR